LTILAKASVVNYDHSSSIIVLAIVIMIVNYDHNSFIIQTTGDTFASLIELSSRVRRSSFTKQDKLTRLVLAVFVYIGQIFHKILAR